MSSLERTIKKVSHVCSEQFEIKNYLYGNMFNFIREIVANREARADTKAAAETEAIKMNMAKVAAETEDIKKASSMKAVADRLALEALKRRNRILDIVSGAAFLFLLGDFIYHDSEIFIKWNMKRHIRNGSSVAIEVNTSPTSTPVSKFTRQLPPLDEVPVVLLGPRGSGKSTALHDFALELKSKKKPVVLINFRELQDSVPRENKPGVDKSKEEDTGARQPDGSVLLTKLTKRICNRISFPYRRSYFNQLLSTVTFAKFGGFGINYNVRDYFSIDFFVANKAIDMLFKCCEEIAYEGTNPVLLLDEIYDLIKDNNLRDLGGGILFNKLGMLLCIACADNQKLNAIATSSSYKIVRALKLRTALKDDKVTVFNLLDIEPELIIARLIERGYSESEAIKFLDVVGPRLWNLRHPLENNPRPELQTWIKDQMVVAAESFALTFQPLDQTQRRRLLSLLKILEKEGSVPYISEYWAFIDNSDLSRILYVSYGNIIFQSRLHETYWAQNRDSLMKTYSK